MNDARAPRRWIALTVACCAMGGLVPFAQALELVGVPPGRPALAWQAVAAIAWWLAAPRMTRWSLADSEARALAGLGLVSLGATAAGTALVIAVQRPPSPYGTTSTFLAIAFGWLPTHAVSAGLLSLVGSWTSQRRQAARAAAREALLQADAVRAELEALRARLEPHFVLNTLNTVAGLARRGDGAQAATVASDLGDLLRFALSESSDAIPFDAEREIVERYLAIEQVRLGDRLRVTWDIAPEARTVAVPALIWQPLVENAIRHGLARRAAPGTLHLAARRDGNVLRLVVDADGPDGDAHDPEAERGLGIGLRTTERRLALLHGADAAVTMVPRPGGMSVTLLLPVRRP